MANLKDMYFKKIEKKQAVLIDTNIIDMFKREPDTMNKFCRKTNNKKIETFVHRATLTEIAGLKAQEKAKSNFNFKKYVFKKLETLSTLKSKCPLYFLLHQANFVFYEIEKNGSLTKFPVFKDVGLNRPDFLIKDILNSNHIYNNTSLIKTLNPNESRSQDTVLKYNRAMKTSYALEDVLFKDFVKNGLKREAKYLNVHIEKLHLHLYWIFTAFLFGNVESIQSIMISVFSREMGSKILDNEHLFCYLRATFIIFYCRLLKWDRDCKNTLSNKKFIEKIENRINDDNILSFAPFVKTFITNDKGIKSKAEDIKGILPISVKTFDEWMDS